jgi:hypothetical protein
MVLGLRFFLEGGQKKKRTKKEDKKRKGKMVR